jgi:hypothetical protein
MTEPGLIPEDGGLPINLKPSGPHSFVIDGVAYRLKECGRGGTRLLACHRPDIGLCIEDIREGVIYLTRRVRGVG